MCISRGLGCRAEFDGGCHVKKQFTVQEANALLPQIETQLKHIQALKQQFTHKYEEMMKMKETIKSMRSRPDADPYFMIESTLDFLQIEAQGMIRQIEETGVQIKDIDIGLIDFPSMKDDEEVLLCWKMGEGKIRYYHGVHDGFIGRKRIESEFDG